VYQGKPAKPCGAYPQVRHDAVGARGTGRRLRRRNPVCGLINASPRSPREEEIEAILARIGVPSDPLGQVSPALAAAFSEWEIVREHYEAAGNK
jgi:hypothetical protein